jgi:hypothetical protein
MPQPFLDFIVNIGKDPEALAAFVKNPAGVATAAGLTPAQKDALLSTDFTDRIEPLLRIENPGAQKQQEALPGAQIGWNMFRIGGAILLARDEIANGTIVGGKGIS